MGSRVGKPAAVPALSVFVMSWAGLAEAGPPLSIDDPGILHPGAFEIIVASTLETRDSVSSYELPVLDVSLGISSNIQVSAVAARVVSDPYGESKQSDFGAGQVGLKWRFLNGDALQMSVAPTYETLLRDGAADRGVADDIDAWLLPVQFQYEFTGWRFNGEVGYAFTHDVADEWSYGAAIAVPLTGSVEGLLELHGSANDEFDDDAWFYRVGADLALDEQFHVLVSVGSTITESGDDDLDLQGYLGLQWFP